MKRSTSQEAVSGDKPFKRGGVRATAGARLGGNYHRSESQTPKSDSFLTPFARWTTDQVMLAPDLSSDIVYVYLEWLVFLSVLFVMFGRSAHGYMI